VEVILKDRGQTGLTGQTGLFHRPVCPVSPVCPSVLSLCPVLQSIEHCVIFRVGTEAILQIFKTKVFSKFAKKEQISDAALLEAVARAEKGLIDAELGGCVIKQRVRREGQGRSTGFRVLIAVRLKKRYVFITGFAKNEKDNLSDEELETVKDIASGWLNADVNKINFSILKGELKEIKHEKKIQ
jgi:hypothetical protein